MGKIIIYSAIIGDYDNIVTPKIIDKDVEYILFTDNLGYKSDVWKIINIKVTGGFKKTARYIKLNPHKVLPPHNISMWVDGALTPNFDNTENLLREIEFNNGVMRYKHETRNCIYNESDVVVASKFDDPNVVALQMESYYNEGLPLDYGLFETGFMIRKNNDNINSFNELWWKEVSNKSYRDQLSQMYVSWKTKIVIKPIKIGKSIRDNKFLQPIRKHKKNETKPTKTEYIVENSGKVTDRILF